MSSPRPAAVVVLAAGEGTRMRSSTPKVLHRVRGRSLLGHVLAASAPLEARSTVVVVGHGRDRVVEHLGSVAPDAVPVVQEQQNGTGHAVRAALSAVPDGGGAVVVVSGDTPLLRSQTLEALLSEHRSHRSAATLLTARLADPHGYGRIVRDGEGSVRAIVEHRDADVDVLAIDEINAGIYVFDVDALTEALRRLSTDNSQGEEYLTDVAELLVGDGHVVRALVADDSDEVMGVNDRVQLAQADALLGRRINEGWMRAGVTIVDPATTRVDVGVAIEPDAVLLPWTILAGDTTVAAHAEVGPGAHLLDCRVGQGARVRFTTAEGADIGAHASVGPYTYLRPGTRLGEGARAGAFVEAKNARVGDGSKVPHLSYVGDAEIGVGSNIGAATVFVNYDGVDKHRTVIGDHVRIGSDTMLVAPVTVGDGAYTAAGSVITDDVPAGAMGVARARQRTIKDWVLRRRRGTESARAAESALSREASDGAASDQAGEGGDE